MTKDETVSELKSRGFDAFLENGVVMISMRISNTNVRNLEKLLRSIGYKASWGLRDKTE